MMRASSYIRVFDLQMMDTLLKHKEKLKNLLQFMTFLVIVYFVFSGITWVFRSNNSESREDIYCFREQGDIDVVLCAGSNLLRYYQPLEAWHQKGFTSYNYATSAAKADMLKAFLEDSRKYTKAKLYVCDIRSFPWVEEKVDESSIRNWSDSLPVFSFARWDGITSYLFNRDLTEVDIPSFYFDIIKYHTNTDNLEKEYQWRFKELAPESNTDKGFNPNKKHIPLVKPETTYDRGVLTGQRDKAINTLLDYCDKENLNVLFVCCPFEVSNEDQLTINAVAEIIKDRGYPYVNFNEYYDEIGLDFETDFGDTNHVNYLGAEKYTSYLIGYLSEHYDLPDHRGDPKYAKWDADYESYTADQETWKKSITELVDDHLNAGRIGDSLSEREDFADWYYAIRNGNYSVMIRINDMPDGIPGDNPINDLIADYGIDRTRETYIGIWEGDKPLISTSDDLSAEAEIGVDGGRGTDTCRVSVESATVSIEDTEYPSYDQAIQILVYDNNYKRVIDNVSLLIDNSSVELKRP